MNSNLHRDFNLGLFVIIGFMSLVWLLSISHKSTADIQKVYSINANFSNIGELHIYDPVKIAGVIVGKVSAITLNSTTYQAKVTMLIEHNIKLPTDSSAQILTSGLVGAQYIALQPGSDNHFLYNNQTIGFSSSAIAIEQIITKFLFDMNSSTRGN